MYAVEFQAPIEDGIVHIPKQYAQIQHNPKATFIVMYDYETVSTNSKTANDELDELFAHSNNKIQVTMELATNTDEMINDGIL